MLRRLAIRNFVLFEDIDITFGPGLNVISGETGGGKSNLAQALALLAGARSRKDQIRKGSSGAEITGVFERGGKPVEIRRWIPPTGSGRVSLDGKASSISEIRSLGASLVSITGQHEQISLTDPTSHRHVLDATRGIAPRLEEYSASWVRCQEHAAVLDKLVSAQSDREYRQEFLAHQIKEIRTACPGAGEDEALEREITILKNAERIREGLSTSVGALYEDEGSAVERIGTASRALDAIAAFMDDLEEPLGSLAEASVLVEDASRTLASHLEGLDADPSLLESRQERAYLLDRLKKKHGPGLDDVLARLAEMESELESLESLEERISTTQRDLEMEAGRSVELASKLTRARRRAAGKLSRAIVRELEQLAFDDVEFEVRVDERPRGGLLEGLDADGGDDVRFLFRPNVGEDLAPLDAIASGGELSRVFLAIRSVVGRSDPDETLVFDEADTGIGGKTADALGKMLHNLGRSQQVVCVTHLAQIAAHADTHLLVEKNVQGGRTTSRPRILDDDSRRDEIARMLGGEKITKKSREAASEMLRLARRKTEGRS
jgi:DNA repair protein RecN (Recombination protein N)